MNVELISVTEKAEKHIEYCARMCYNSVERITEDSHIKFLPTKLRDGHLSIFEHANASFHISGISRACSHQLVRQRIASFSQKSQRYVKETDFDFVTPPEVLNNPEALAIYQSTVKTINDAYQKLSDLGIKKEDARFLLPNAAETELTMTTNFREWLHILDLRVSLHAQWEIREMCLLIWKELYRIAPTTFALTYFENWSKDLDYKRDLFTKRIAVG